jgi:hypothetical protein
VKKLLERKMVGKGLKREFRLSYREAFAALAGCETLSREDVLDNEPTSS